MNMTEAVARNWILLSRRMKTDDYYSTGPTDKGSAVNGASFSFVLSSSFFAIDFVPLLLLLQLQLPFES